jgi:hypothetical protein
MLHNASMPRQGSERNRRVLMLRDGVDICAGVEQQIDNRTMPFLRGEHQKRRPKLRAQIRVAAGFEVVRDVQRIATLDCVVQGLDRVCVQGHL